MLELTPAEVVTRDAIMAAPDVVKNTTTQDITEPNANPGTTRDTRREWSSATVEVGKKYVWTITFMHPPSHPAWCARSNTMETIE